MKRRGKRGTAALDEVHGKTTIAGGERKAQARRRRFAGRGQRPKKPGDGAACLRRDRQAL